MTTRERWERMTNPKTVEDYGLTVPLDDLLRDAPDLYQQYIAPLHLPVGHA